MLSQRSLATFPKRGKVARCGGSPLIRCGATTPHDAALVVVTGRAQRSPGLARRRTPHFPHGYV